MPAIREPQPRALGRDRRAIPARVVDRHGQGWTTGAEQARRASTNFVQMTFMHGPRVCIGKDSAKAEFRCAAAGIFGSFWLELQEVD